ncbi:MAG: hypothetical protein JW783_09190 [Bacteroidales bacterium]|nr:hypothetical protein [Bacteroidales bacterium]MBN2749740.1 hypothetical protein [Bacteroidales bacterium]
MRKVLFWIAAIVITLATVIYQQKTGPTYPEKVTYSIDNQTKLLTLTRSGETNIDIEVTIDSLPLEWEATLFYRKYPTNSDWAAEPFMMNANGGVTTYLPSQPAAGKLEYYIEMENLVTQEAFSIKKDEPVVIRFKGAVPAFALIPHVLLMFIAMLLSNLTGIMAAFMHKRFKFYMLLTIIALFVGGLVFGPIVQHYAFGQAWTGWPLGSDLTDNKTLIAFVAWLVALLVNRKEDRPLVVIFAALVTMAIYLIPHSLRGSELNHETGEIVTGIVTTFIR